MNERNNANKLRAIRAVLSNAYRKFNNLNKGSKILLKVGAAVLFSFLLVALALSILFITGTLRFDGQAQIIKWTVLYSFRFWIMMVFGSIILDILIKR